MTTRLPVAVRLFSGGIVSPATRRFCCGRKSMAKWMRFARGLPVYAACFSISSRRISMSAAWTTSSSSTIPRFRSVGKPAESDSPSIPTVPVIEGEESEFVRVRRRSWARLIAKTWLENPAVCRSSGKEMKILAAISGSSPMQRRRGSGTSARASSGPSIGLPRAGRERHREPSWDPPWPPAPAASSWGTAPPPAVLVRSKVHRAGLDVARIGGAVTTGTGGPTSSTPPLEIDRARRIRALREEIEVV
jgi:hypothetical protein